MSYAVVFTAVQSGRADNEMLCRLQGAIASLRATQYAADIALVYHRSLTSSKLCENVQEIINILMTKVYDLRFINTICFPTRRNHQQIKELAIKSDVFRKKALS